VGLLSVPDRVPIVYVDSVSFLNLRPDLEIPGHKISFLFSSFCVDSKMSYILIYSHFIHCLVCYTSVAKELVPSSHILAANSKEQLQAMEELNSLLQYSVK
jgi:hypothetical protein